jgi:hypothetical protein
MVERHVHQGDLQPGADAAQEVEPGAGHLGAATHVDGAEQFAQLEVIPGLEVEAGDLAVGAQGGEVVFTAGGHAVDDRVREGAHHGREPGLGLRGDHAGRLDLCGQALRLGDEGLLLGGRGLGHRFAERVLRRAQGLEAGDRGPSLGVGGERRVDRVDGVAPRLLRTLDEVGVFA